ncbi:Zn-ribbon domain-containing OB-fold protein [Frateuria aurantia]
MTTSDTCSKPTPVRDPETDEFFDAARRGRLLLRYCRHCSHYALRPGKHCPECLSPLTWVSGSGLAQVWTWTRIHHAAHPGFAADVPYVLVTARMAEGPLLTLRLIDDDGGNGDIEVGTPLQVDFIEHPDADPTPVFRRAADD